MNGDKAALRRKFDAFVSALGEVHEVLVQWLPDLAVPWERELLAPALEVEAAPEERLDDVKALARTPRQFWGSGPNSRSERYIQRAKFEDQLRLNNDLDDKCERASLAGDALLLQLEPKARYR